MVWDLKNEEFKICTIFHKFHYNLFSSSFSLFSYLVLRSNRVSEAKTIRNGNNYLLN